MKYNGCIDTLEMILYGGWEETLYTKKRQRGRWWQQIIVLFE